MTPNQLAKLTDEELLALDKIVASVEAERKQGAGFSQYQDNPVGFATDVLGVTPWDRQAEILQAVAANPKVAIRSGHKVGKSTSVAILALWWWSTRPRALVVLTSSTDPQIEKIIWPELRRIYALAGGKAKLGGDLAISHRTGLRALDGRRVFGVSTNRTENMGGFSGAELLFLADEASGIDDAIFEAIEGNRAGGARVAMFGNPTRMLGTFYDAFHEKAEFWERIHVSSEESPNVREGRVVIPGLATAEYIAEKRRELGGPGNPIYDVRIAGNFPSQGESSIIGLALVEAARKRWRDPVPADGVLEIGVDVARFGDDETVIYARRGKYLYKPMVLKSMDGVDVAGHVLKMVRELRTGAPPVTYQRGPGGDHPVVRGAEVPKVKVDVIGVGASVFDQLKRSSEVQAIAVNVAESATDENYSRLRDQLWFALKTFLVEGGAIPDVQALSADMTAPTYSFDPRGRIKVEGKDEIKAKRSGNRSPDHADAAALAVYSPVVFKAGASAATFLDF